MPRGWSGVDPCRSRSKLGNEPLPPSSRLQTSSLFVYPCALIVKSIIECSWVTCQGLVQVPLLCPSSCVARYVGRGRLADDDTLAQPPLLENQPVRSPCFSASSRGVKMRNIRIIFVMAAVYLSLVRTTALPEDTDLYTPFTLARRLHGSKLAFPESA
jgi:hypothetical protein